MPNPWNQLIAALPNPHFLQTCEWAQVKAAYGWQPLYLVWDDAGCTVSKDFSAPWPATVKAAALVLKKTVPTPGLAARLSILYAPKGPLLDWNDQPLRRRVLDDLQRFARQQGGIFLKIDPDVVLGSGIPGSKDDITEPGGEAVREEMSCRGWRFSSDQIQFRNTVMVEVGTSTEEEMLARMKQKTRYNVRLAAKKGVSVRIGSQNDWPLLYKMYAETSARDGFVIREEAYYRKVWGLFDNARDDTLRDDTSRDDNSRADTSILEHRTSNIEYQAPNIEYRDPNIEYRTPNIEYQAPNIPLAQPLIAEVDGEAVAALVVFAFAGRAYYVHGMSREAHREKMPTYLLQWEAMKWAKARGCATYDLWGAPDVFDESDKMWGVFRFKDGLGGRTLRTLGAWDYAPNPLWYGFYTRVMPKILGALRAIGRRKTLQGLGG